MRSKQELRRELVRARRALTADEAAASSLAIAARLLAAVDWDSVRSLHVYRSMAEWREVDTGPIIAAVRERWPHVAISSPTLALDQPIPEEPFDVIVVPVLGFDRGNHRLGLGGGFYDRFLARQPAARKIGIAYAWAELAEDVPWEAHDVVLDEIVTDG